MPGLSQRQQVGPAQGGAAPQSAEATACDWGTLTGNAGTLSAFGTGMAGASLFGDVWDTGSSWGSEAWDWAGDAWDSSTDWASDTWDAGSEWAGDTWDEGAEWASDTWEGAKDVAGDVWTGEYFAGDVPPGGAEGTVFSRESLESRVGQDYAGENTEELAQVMTALTGEQSPEELDASLQQLSQIRGVPVEDLRTQHAQYVELKAEADKHEEEHGEIEDLDQERHPDFMGSTSQLRYGSYAGEMFGIDPVFGALLNPTGGLVGPANDSYQADPNSVAAYHGEAHDAAGYLLNYQERGPGYTYAEGNEEPGTSPLGGQWSGFDLWTDILGEDGERNDIPFLSAGTEHTLEGMARVVGATVEGGWNDATDWAGDQWDSGTDWVGDTWDAGTQWAGDAWDSSTDWAGDQWDSGTEWAGDTWDSTTEWAGDAWDTAGGVVDSGLDMAGEAWDSAADTAGGAWDSSTEWVGSWFD